MDSNPELQCVRRTLEFSHVVRGLTRILSEHAAGQRVEETHEEFTSEALAQLGDVELALSDLEACGIDADEPMLRESIAKLKGGIPSLNPKDEGFQLAATLVSIEAMKIRAHVSHQCGSTH